MSDIKQIIINIKKEIAKTFPSISHIFDCFRVLKEEVSPDTAYYDIVGEIFKFNPNFYMDFIYPKMKSSEMARYIVETYSLYEGERIIYEFRGKITKSKPTSFSQPFVYIRGATIYITNYRIIAQGKLSVGGGKEISHSALENVIREQRAKKGRNREKKNMRNISISQDLPCYGYQFRSRNHFGLKKKSKSVKYRVFNSSQFWIDPSSRWATSERFYEAITDIKIKPPKNQVSELYDILRKDADQTLEVFQELNSAKIRNLYNLKELWRSEEYEDFKDSDYLDIAMMVYELIPEYFMSSIYPKMQTWEFPSFLRVKNKLFEEILKREVASTEQ